MSVRRFAKTVVAVAPLLVGTAVPAHGCLVLPENQGTQTAAEMDAFPCGDVGCGPSAPFEELQEADARNEGQGFSCDPMCVAGNPDHPGGPDPD